MHPVHRDVKSLFESALRLTGGGGVIHDARQGSARVSKLVASEEVKSSSVLPPLLDARGEKKISQSA